MKILSMVLTKNNLVFHNNPLENDGGPMWRMLVKLILMWVMLMVVLEKGGGDESPHLHLLILFWEE